MAMVWSSEPELIAKLRGRVMLPRTAGVVLGIGDDCAIVRPRGAPEDWLYTTDMLIEETHFRRETHGARDVGWKALARGLSDIAAMGGEPRFCLLSLTLAGWIDARWVDGFYDRLLALAGRAGTSLIGGSCPGSPHAMIFAPVLIRSVPSFSPTVDDSSTKITSPAWLSNFDLKVGCLRPRASRSSPVRS